ncbi:hypothetical protein VK792_15925 [Mesobacterium sp. TK19101]|uniref:Uncharacterized protein n=1 Tax=Mesobacterium hydrothermale TaxID=3111907 RepID=A0ABU6HKB6_9RHOB|nr:hypothetical protein [Mesobacterium sp. TK19101]MEC3862781.1 hypothetical protein [Mesobacterium sp. TK19101]
MRLAGLAYAQARLQARLAELPSARDWQLIETGRDFGQTLEAARQGALGRYVSRLSRESTAADIEQALRFAWTELVDEVAGWTPARWQASLRWLTPLPHLRLPDARPDPLPADDAPETLVSKVWQAEFERRLPTADAGVLGALDPLLRRFLFGPAPAEGAETVARRLEDLFRTRGREPVAIIGWLGLMALVLERLRGALLRALLFPAEPAEGAP